MTTVKVTLNLKISLKNVEEIESAVEHLNDCIQHAAWDSTPNNLAQEVSLDCSSSIKEKIKEKRKIRKLWQVTRCPEVKKRLNHAVKELKILLNKEANEESY